MIHDLRRAGGIHHLAALEPVFEPRRLRRRALQVLHRRHRLGVGQHRVRLEAPAALDPEVAGVGHVVQAADDGRVAGQAHQVARLLHQLAQELADALPDRALGGRALLAQDARAVDGPILRRVHQRVVLLVVQRAVLDRIHQRLVRRLVAGHRQRHIAQHSHLLGRALLDGCGQRQHPVLADCALHVGRHHPFGVVQDLVHSHVGALAGALEQPDDLGHRVVFAARLAGLVARGLDGDSQVRGQRRVLVQRPQCELHRLMVQLAGAARFEQLGANVVHVAHPPAHHAVDLLDRADLAHAVGQHLGAHDESAVADLAGAVLVDELLHRSGGLHSRHRRALVALARVLTVQPCSGDLPQPGPQQVPIGA